MLDKRSFIRYNKHNEHLFGGGNDMTFGFTLSTIFEVLLFAAVVWGILNEKKLIAFEKRICASFKRRKFKVVESQNCFYKAS